MSKLVMTRKVEIVNPDGWKWEILSHDDHITVSLVDEIDSELAIVTMTKEEASLISQVLMELTK